jgi:hypothetical protein
VLRHVESDREQNGAKSCESFLSTRTIMLPLALASKMYSLGQGRLLDEPTRMRVFTKIASPESLWMEPTNNTHACRVARFA